MHLCANLYSWPSWGRRGGRGTRTVQSRHKPTWLNYAHLQLGPKGRGLTWNWNHMKVKPLLFTECEWLSSALLLLQCQRAGHTRSWNLCAGQVSPVMLCYGSWPLRADVSSGSTFFSCLREVEWVRSLLFSLVPSSCSGVPSVSSPRPDRPAALHQPHTNKVKIEGLHKTSVNINVSELSLIMKDLILNEQVWARNESQE